MFTCMRICKGARMKRLTVSMDDQVYDDLAGVSERLGFSKSAVVNWVLGDVMCDILSILGDLDLDSIHDGRRSRGQTRKLIEEAMSAVYDTLDASHRQGRS